MPNVLKTVQNSQGRSAGAIPGRTFERTQGCYNCAHFENGEKSKLYWINTCRPRDVGHVKAYELEGKIAAAKELADTIKASDAAIKAGVAGLCLAGKVKSEYVVHNYLCDGWSARQGASIAREGGAPDLLPEEIRDRVDG